MKTIRDYDLKGKRVIIRVDFNVPIKNGVIQDDNRIIESLPTVNYALENGAKVILFSHLGKVKTIEDKTKNDLKPVAERLNNLLNRKVLFVENTRDLEQTNNLKDGEVALVQNTRYEDLEGKKESSNDSDLAKYWASFGDIFINDAFGSSHRSHASLVGIAKLLPSGIGFLVEKELKELDNVINIKERPFTVIMGGAKIEDKIEIIESLVKKADYILVGTAMAFSFLSSKGIDVGKSLIDVNSIDFCKKMLETNKDKIILPVDAYTVKNIGEKPIIKKIEEFDNDDIGMDIGPLTSSLFEEYLNKSKTVFWNGPVGMFEEDTYANGTKKIINTLEKLDIIKIAGGGDTASAIKKFNKKEVFTHISTGGGASLELVEGKKLPGIEAI